MCCLAMLPTRRFSRQPLTSSETLYWLPIRSLHSRCWVTVDTNGVPVARRHSTRTSIVAQRGSLKPTRFCSLRCRYMPHRVQQARSGLVTMLARRRFYSGALVTQTYTAQQQVYCVLMERSQLAHTAHHYPPHLWMGRNIRW